MERKLVLGLHMQLNKYDLKRESAYTLMEAEEVGDERKWLERETRTGKWR